MSKQAKTDPAKVAAEVESMQEELKNLQVALGQLVDALIAEGKPDFEEIKKLQGLKKKALSSKADTPREAAEPRKAKPKRAGKAKK
jgi:hypothetical protein